MTDEGTERCGVGKGGCRWDARNAEDVLTW